AVHPAHARRRASDRPPAPRPLQRLQRARGGRAVARARRLARRRRRGPARGLPRLRPGRDLSILLVKNPAGANEVLRTLALEPGQHDLLAILNDQVADGRDVSWVWDADFEVLAGRVRHVTCSGTRAAEMALRLKYAGVEAARIAVEPQLDAGLDRALRDGDG